MRDQALAYSTCEKGCQRPCTFMIFMQLCLQALDSYTSLVDKYGDLALASYARIGRALLLYQTGQRQESVLELQGLASSLRGYAEASRQVNCSS